MPVPPTSLPRPYRTVDFAASLVGGMSGLVLLLSAGGMAPLMGSLFQGPVAAGLMLAMALALFRANRPGRVAPLPGLILASAVAGVSLGTLVAYGFGGGLARMPDGALPLLRLSMLTTLGLIPLSTGFLLGPGRPRASWGFRQTAAILALVPIVIGSMVLVSYPEGSLILNGGRSTPMGLLSALDCSVLGLAALGLSGGDVWPLALFGSESERMEQGGGRWFRRRPFRLFLLLTVGILALGSLYLRGQVRGARRAAEKSLALAADSRAREIQGWFRERAGDAELILHSPFLQEGLRRALMGDPSQAQAQALRQWMEALASAYGYRQASLFDAEGRLRISLKPEGPTAPRGQDGRFFREALEGGRVVFADLHRTSDPPGIQLCFWVPVLAPGGRPLGALSLRVDARSFLYPLLEASTSLGSSAEAFLLRREGDEALFLSALRGQPDSALNLRVPLDRNPGAPAIRAARDQQGAFVARDPRGRTVIAALRRVQGTPWALVVQVDETEILGPLRRWAGLSAAGLLGLVALLAMGMGLMVRQGDARRILAHLAFERERKEFAERFSKVFSTSPDAMSITRLRDGVYLDVNQGFTRITGYAPEEVLGRSSLDPDLDIWVRPQDRAALLERLRAEGEAVDLEADFRLKGGRIIPCVMTAKILELGQDTCLISATRDLTQRRQAEEERRQLEHRLHQAQRQESLGALAGGVAHDMNNVLGAILSLASAHRSQVEPGDPLAGSFDTIINACLRGRGVVKGLLCFARGELEETGRVDLNALVGEVMELLSRTTVGKLELEARLEPALRPMRGDGGSLSHAIMNLCVNAMDAMPGGGSLVLRTENLEDGQVRLTVSDTGQGMTPEVLDRAMEPFFSTKPVGKGTGLGLAMVFGTVKAHEGTLEMHSRPGQGTRVLLTFPACSEEAFPAPAPEPVTAAAPEALDLLLVDDDELIRGSVGPMLEQCGHRVRTAAGGEEALALLDGGLGPDLVILDLNMPGLSGADTLRGILSLRPRQAVLLASGYSEEDYGLLLSLGPRIGFLQKPFTLSELLAKLGTFRSPEA